MYTVIVEDQEPISGPSVFTLHMYYSDRTSITTIQTELQNRVISSLSDLNRNNGSNMDGTPTSAVTE
jgi:hypothetical protein